MTLYPSGRQRYSKQRIAEGKEGRVTLQLFAGLSDDEAQARDQLLTELAQKMVAAGLDATLVIRPTLKKLASADLQVAQNFERYVRTKILPNKREAIAASPTVKEFARQWTSGELEKRYPGRAGHRQNAKNDHSVLAKHVFPLIGDKLMSALTFADVELVSDKLDPSLEASTRVVYLRSFGRLLELAVSPAKLLAANPMPRRGFLPRVSRKSFPFIYPAEEARLMRCEAIPLWRRIMWGTAFREGMRMSNVANLKRSDLDFDHGIITLRRHKTDKRVGVLVFPMDPGTLATLRWWCEREGIEGDALLFPDADKKSAAEIFREDLLLAGVTRAELHTTVDGSRRARAHETRSTFCTLARGINKPNEWIMLRTGHTSIKQLDEYVRPATLARELNLGWYQDLATLVGADRQEAKSCPRIEGSEEKTGVVDSPCRSSPCR